MIPEIQDVVKLDEQTLIDAFLLIFRKMTNKIISEMYLNGKKINLEDPKERVRLAQAVVIALGLEAISTVLLGIAKHYGKDGKPASSSKPKYKLLED